MQRIHRWPLVLLALLGLGCGPSTSNEPDAEGTQSGRWRRAPEAQELTAEQQAQREQLEAIGYLAGSSKAPDASGVVRHDRARSQPGLGFYVSGHAPEAILMDQDGELLHRWSYDYADAFPEHHPDESNPNDEFWRRAHLYPDGSILAIHDGLGILKLDKDSRLLWANPNNAHHDLAVLADGDIVTLTREAKLIPRVMENDVVLEDFVARLGPDGTTKATLSLLETMERSEPEHDWREAWWRLWKIEETRKLAAPPTDLFHSNSVTVLDGRFADRGEHFAAGNLLLSFCHLEMVLIVDPRQGRTLWSSVGEWALQHDPQLTPRGGLLVFDNNWRDGQSRMVETDLASGEVLWEYSGSETEPFYSRTCGASQQLDNGNLLITESDAGRALEITPEGEIVWEFLNPARAGDEREYIATLFDVVRVPEESVAGWLR